MNFIQAEVMNDLVVTYYNAVISQYWPAYFTRKRFSLFFVSVPCARLSCPSRSRQLLRARKYTVSYHISYIL